MNALSSLIDNFNSALSAQQSKLQDMTVDVIADKSTLVDLAALLAFIRDAVDSGEPKTVSLQIGKNKRGQFHFMCNNTEVPALKCQLSAFIN